jgi:hypothetical protein
MSRKNNKAKYARQVAHLQQDEKKRLDKHKKRNESRLTNTAIREGRLPDPMKEKKNASKKPKVAPVVALDKNTRKMEKMLNKMNLDKSAPEGDSSDYEDVKSQEDMDVDAQTITKTIKKKKPLPRTYY